jgi:hypothetical protein
MFHFATHKRTVHAEMGFQSAKRKKLCAAGTVEGAGATLS